MSSGGQNGQLNALLALITESVATVQNEFSQSSKPYVPSLNDTEPHPLDTQFSSPELIKAVRTIQGACVQLCATAVRPNRTLLNVSGALSQRSYKYSLIPILEGVQREMWFMTIG